MCFGIRTWYFHGQQFAVEFFAGWLTEYSLSVDNLFVCVGVFIHWQADDDKKIQQFNYEATKESIKRAVAGSPTAAEVVAKKGTVSHPFAAN